MLGYVLTIEAVTIAVVTATAIHPRISHQDLVHFALLVGCAIVYIELTRGVERVREITAGSGPVMHADSAWCIAALLVLPPILASAVVTIIFTWLWLRVWRHRRPLYRWIFSVATIVLATDAATPVLAVGHAYPGVPTTPATVGLAVLAATLRFLVNFSLVFGAIVLSSPNLHPRQLVDSLSERVMEVGALGLGLVAATVLVDNPVVLVGVIAAAATMHRGILVAQFRKAARVDGKTGLNTASWWHQIADTALQRAHAAGTGLAVLMLDLDHFKTINDNHGHLAGDQVLRAVADAVTGEIRDSDTAGRWGGEEFVILIPDVDRTELIAIAERIRRRIHTLVVTVSDDTSTIDGLTVSIGAARYPHPGINSVDDLVLAADTALYRAKKAGRDQVATTD